MITLVGNCTPQAVDPAAWLADVPGNLATWPAKPKGWREARHAG